MWGEPREGTEAHAVKKEAERRKKLAQEKGLDNLLVDTYDNLRHYPSWIKDSRNKRWIHPSISEAKYVGEKYSYNIQFKFDGKVYKIIREKGFSPEFGDGTWYDLILYLDEKKVFAITEEETSDQYSTYHRPISVNAYINDSWVDDFKNIHEYDKRVSEETELEFAEDPKRTQALKDDFGITDITPESKSSEAQSVEEAKKSIWSKWWVWVIIIIILISLLNW